MAKWRCVMWIVLAAATLGGCPKKDSHVAQEANEAPPPPFVEADVVVAALRPQYAPVILPVPRAADATAETTVDWTTYSLQITGAAVAKANSAQDKLMALRAAELDAGKNALLAARGVAVGGNGLLVKLPDGTWEATAMVSQGERIATDWDAATLRARVTMRYPLSALRAEFRVESPAAPPPRYSPARAQSIDADLIIIDARGGFEPCLFPRLATEKNETLFDAASLTPLQRNQQHTAVYVACGDPAAATSEPAQMSKRIVLRARPAGTVLVLDPNAMAELNRHPAWPLLMAAGRLVIVVDNVQPGKP